MVLLKSQISLYLLLWATTSIKCNPQVQFVFQPAQSFNPYAQTNSLNNNHNNVQLQSGFTPTTNQNNGFQSNYIAQQQPPVPSRSGISSVMDAAVQEATQFVDQTEKPVFHNDSRSVFGTQSYVARAGHGRGGHNYCKFSPTTEKIGRASHVNIKAYEILQNRYQVPKHLAIAHLRARMLDFCTREERPLTCDPTARYRTIDGTCNNLRNPYWGTAFEQMDRLVPAVYEDGWNEPRGAGKSLGGTRLPNPRVVSLSVHRDYVNPDRRMTNMVPQIGQVSFFVHWIDI